MPDVLREPSVEPRDSVSSTDSIDQLFSAPDTRSSSERDVESAEKLLLERNSSRSDVRRLRESSRLERERSADATSTRFPSQESIDLRLSLSSSSA